MSENKENKVNDTLVDNKEPTKVIENEKSTVVVDEKPISTQSAQVKTEEVVAAKTEEVVAAKVSDEKNHSSTSIRTSTDEVDKEAKLVTKTKLLESGVQYGHQIQWWNPKMKPFINFKKNGIHIINLHKTIASLQNAYSTVQKLTEANKTILFVGTTRQSKDAVKLNAERIGAFYVDNRWLGGLLTNFKTIRNSVNRLKHLEKLSKENFEGYTKKEGVLLKKELDKLNANLGGIKNMRKVPDAIFVSSTKADKIAILEAKKLHIPIIGIVDTNEDPTLIEFPIIANDDAIKSVSLIVTIMADAVASVQGKPLLAAFQGETVKILGIDENYVKPAYPKRRYNNNRGSSTGRYQNNNNKYQGYNNNRNSNYSNSGTRTSTTSTNAVNTKNEANTSTKDATTSTTPVVNVIKTTEQKV